MKETRAPPPLEKKKVHSEKCHLHKIVEKINSSIVTYRCLPEDTEQERMVGFGVENTKGHEKTLGVTGTFIILIVMVS